MDTVILALRVLVSLAVVVALLWLVQRKSLKWASKRRATTAIEVAGKKSIGSKANVVVVDIDGTRFVLGVTDHGVSVLRTAEAPEPVEVAAPVRAPKPVRMPKFAEALHAATDAATAAAADAQQGEDAEHPAAERPAAAQPGAMPTASLTSLATWKAAAKSLRTARWPH